MERNSVFPPSIRSGIVIDAHSCCTPFDVYQIADETQSMAQDKTELQALRVPAIRPLKIGEPFPARLKNDQSLGIIFLFCV